MDRRKYDRTKGKKVEEKRAVLSAGSQSSPPSKLLNNNAPECYSATPRVSRLQDEVTG
jgi:hypothetical protein